MKRNTQLLGAVSAFALIAVSSTPAMAEGIRAGTDITNEVDVTYAVGGVTQNVVEASDTFAVDRRVNVTVTQVDSPKGVNPGEDDAFLTFDVQNLSNDVIDLDLTANLEAGDSNDISTFTIYEDTNNSGTFDAGDTVVTFLDEVEADDTIRVFVVADIDLNAENDDSFDVSLNADAHEADTGAGGDGNDDNTLGAELSGAGSDSADQSIVDTVLADGSSGIAGDAANDGSFSAQGTFDVEGAEVTVVKSSLVISDPVNGVSANAKAIPGAVIRYCIAVSNASGGEDATNIVVEDTLPADVVFNPGTIRVNTPVTVAGSEATCDISGITPETDLADADDAEFDDSGASDVVTGRLSTVSGGSGLGLAFEVTIPAATAPTP